MKSLLLDTNQVVKSADDIPKISLYIDTLGP